MESINRRDLLKLGGTVVAAAAMPISPGPGAAQTPKRGGVFRVRGEDPVGFDPHLTVAFKTMMNLSFPHSRLVKVKIAATALFLASDDASFITGQWISPNGGLFIG